LVRRIEAVYLLDNFVFDSLCHNGTNVGKRIFDVKGARIAGCKRS
jgi:hypothetical protein